MGHGVWRCGFHSWHGGWAIGGSMGGGGVARQLKIFVSQDGCWGGSGHILGKLAWGLLGLFSCVRKIGWDMDGRGNGGALRLA